MIEDIVNKPNFCILPWTHLYYFTDGYVYPCPSLVNDKSMRLGKCTDSKDALWNSEVLKDLRKKMLKDEFIKPCFKMCNGSLNSCKKYVGLESLEHAKETILTTKEDGTANYNFINWNLIESNLCNLQCKYCSFYYSNLWDENKEVRRGLPFNDLIDLYDSNYDLVKEIWFASGEPVLQKSTYYFLNRLIKDKRTNVKIRLITNLMKTNYLGQNIFDLLKQFKDVIVFGSWDLNGERGEFIRKNSSAPVIKNTIKQINEKGIPFILQSVISIFNIYYFPEFHKEMYEEGLLKKDNIRYYNLNGPHKFRYSILPLKIKNKIKDNLLLYKEWLGPGLSEFPNRECPLKVIDKIIETLYTGKWGHWDFNENINEEKYRIFYNEIFYKNGVLDKNTFKLFKEILL